MNWYICFLIVITNNMLFSATQQNMGTSLNDERKLNAALKKIDATVESLKNDPTRYKEYLKKMNTFLRQKVDMENIATSPMKPEQKLAYLRRVNSYLKQQQEAILNPGSEPVSITPINSTDEGAPISRSDWKSSRKRTFLEMTSSTEASKNDFKRFKQRPVADGLADNLLVKNPNDFKVFKRRTEGGLVTNPNDLKALKGRSLFNR
ncbi:MAG: hypothetical protein HEEMFOPI_00402 [Holosporales bacterium]